MARRAFRPRIWTFGLLALLLGLATFAGARPLRSRAVGLEVVAVDPGGAGVRAGLRPGDVILSVRRDGAPPANPRPFEAMVTSCSRFAGIEEEEAPRGPISLQVRRGATALRLGLYPWVWKIEVRGAAGGPEARACAALARASRALDARQWEAADAALAEAEAAARRTRDPLLLARVYEEQGVSLASRDVETARAEALLLSALRLRRRALPGSVTEAHALKTLGNFWFRRDEARSVPVLAAARRLFSRQAPESLEYARLLSSLGQNELVAGRREAGIRLVTEALALARRLSPGGLEEASALNTLGNAAMDGGDYAAAERFYRQTFLLLQRHDPIGQNTAGCLLNLGAVASRRGDMAASESYTTAALHRFEAVVPGGRGVILCLDNLGTDAMERFDAGRAEALFRRAFVLQSRIGEGPMTASLLSHLARTASSQGRLAEAEGLVQRALAASLRFADGDSASRVYLALGDIRYDRKDFAGAQRAYEEALAIRRRLGLESTADASLLHAIALTLDERHDDPRRIEEILRRALDIARRHTPGGHTEALILNTLGALLRREGRTAEAGAAFAAALDALEVQAGHLGGSDETRSGFERNAVGFYADKIDFDLSQGHPAEALLTLERSRARRLLEMLAERDLLFDRDVPGGLLARQRRLDEEQSGAREELAGLDSARDAARIEEIRQRLADLRVEAEGLARRIAQASPRYASLRQP